MTRVVVCGIAGQLPLGGVALHYLQYCLGLRDLDIEVLYLEDNRAWPYHPWRNEPDQDASYTVPWLTQLFGHFELDWAYRDPHGRYHGLAEADVHRRCADADVLLNVSGGHEPDAHHRFARVLAYVDTDPGFVQVSAAGGDRHTRSWLEAHDVLFTFAEAIGGPACRVPTAGMSWLPTRQPVHLPFWADVGDDLGDVYTTVMNWRAYHATEWEGEAWGQKDAEFGHVKELPAVTGLAMELALGGADAPYDELKAAGWRIVDPREPTRDVWAFRDYVEASRGEVSVAKQAYVRSRGGWFSERSANYLAAGRPVVAQDTGWVAALGARDEGLFGFSDAEEARTAVLAVEADPARHSAAARAIAAELFDARAVLEKLLADAGA